MRKSARVSGGGEPAPAGKVHGLPDVPAPALLSYIKQVSAEPSWDGRRLASILNVESARVPQIAALLEMLGYAEAVPNRKGHWRNTAAGNTVSGAKPPRFNRERILEALEELRKRADEMNADRSSPFRVTDLLAFGDFLDEHDKAQAADVGVRLAPRQPDEAASATATEREREQRALSGLRGKSSMLRLHLMEDWMRRRSRRDLLPAS